MARLLFSLFAGLVFLASVDCRQRKREEMRKQYKCISKQIDNKAECKTMLGNPVLKRSEGVLSGATERDLRKANKRSRRKPKYSCPTHGLQRFRYNSTVAERSLSPYEDVITYDKRRIPSYIVQKRCLCKGCINPKKEQETHSLKSVPVTVLVEVYRKKRKANVYVKAKEPIAVGCTCVVPINKT